MANNRHEWVNPIVVENAEIKWANFEGKETPNNREGVRTFCLVIRDPEQAEILAGDGWNIKHHDPREDGDQDEYDYLPVFIQYDPIPPSIFHVKDGNATLLNEDSVATLDNKIYKNIDLKIVPYFWEYPKGSPSAKHGIKAMVDTMYVETVVTDPFANKYRHSNDVLYRENPVGDDLPFDT